MVVLTYNIDYNILIFHLASGQVEYLRSIIDIVCQNDHSKQLTNRFGATGHVAPNRLKTSWKRETGPNRSETGSERKAWSCLREQIGPHFCSRCRLYLVSKQELRIVLAFWLFSPI